MPEKSQRETHHRRRSHGDLGLTDVQASTRRAGAAGGRVVAVLTVGPGFETAVRAAAREAASHHISVDATLAAREAVSEHIRTKVRAAARELISTEGRGT
jgi:chromosome segregation ATPase